MVHWQSALRLPEGAVRLAASAHEPVHAFRAGKHAWGVQFHPEFDAEAMRGYIDNLRGELTAMGTDPAALRDGVGDTAVAASLLGRFARIAEARQGV